MNRYTMLGQRLKTRNGWLTITTVVSLLLVVSVWINSTVRDHYYEQRNQERNADSEAIRKHYEGTDDKLVVFTQKKRDIEKEFSDLATGHTEAMKKLAPLLREIEQDAEQGKEMQRAFNQKWGVKL